MKEFYLIVPELALHAGPHVLSGCLSLHGNWAEAAPVATYLNCLYFLRAAGWKFQLTSPGETVSLHHSSCSTELGKAGAEGREVSCIAWSGTGDPAQGTGGSLGTQRVAQLWYSESLLGPSPFSRQHSDKVSSFIWAVRFQARAKEWQKASVRDSSATKAAFFVPFVCLHTHIYILWIEIKTLS